MTAAPSPGSDADLRMEAARWFAVMRGPQAAAMRPALERWLAQDERHRRAYAAAVDVFAMGKILQTGSAPSGGVEFARRMPRRALAGTAAAAVLAMGAGTLWFYRQGGAPDGLVAAAEPARSGLDLRAPPDRQRILGLPDGSSVVLDRSTRLAVAFSGVRRLTRLHNGRARFDVARDGRPFTVHAGSARITAIGTVFDVSLPPSGRTSVHMVHGRVAIVEHGRRLQLSQGQSVVLGTARSASGVMVAGVAGSRWLASRIDCDRVPLGALLAQASGFSGPTIRLGSPELAALRVSGTFRIDDQRRLASNLALVLGLRVVDEPPGTLLLVRRATAA